MARTATRQGASWLRRLKTTRVRHTCCSRERRIEVPKRFCSAHPCGNVVPLGVRYCDEHRHLEPTKKAKIFYLSPAWQRFRAWYIQKYPFCVVCESHGRLVKAKIVDHVTEIEDGGLRLSEENCQSLCSSCHNKKTAEMARQRKNHQAGGKENRPGSAKQN